MEQSSKSVTVYLETGKKRVFAGALEWPGWCRSGADETAALQALLDYGPRYVQSLGEAAAGLHVPGEIAGFQVVERLEGNSTTDFGAPAAIPARDAEAMSADELARCEQILKACWQTLDDAAGRAAGKELRKGPRGGGRELEGILAHVLGGEGGYLSAVGWKFKPDPQSGVEQQIAQTRQAVLDALAASAHGQIPAVGPKGGARWPARFFTRREAWHVLDHAWEIEDRVLPAA